MNSEKNREYVTLFSIGNNIKVLGQKDPKKHGKLPEESHIPNRIYVSFYLNGKDVKEIAKYGQDGKKIYSIHTDDHKGIKPHFHNWKDGKQEKGAHPLTLEMKVLLEKIRNYEK